jgi:hypothetical protein
VTRPAGVIVMAVIAALNGVFNVAAAGNAFMDLRLPVIGGLGNTYVVIGMLVVGFIWLLTAWGLWTAAGWARTLGLIWSALGLLTAVLLVATSFNQLLAVLPSVLVNAAVPLFVYWYLRKPEIRRWFEASFS